MGAPDIAVARRQQIALDRDKVRAAIRTLPAEYVRYMLADAVELLPPARLHAVARQYLDLRRLRPDSNTARANLIADVKAFEHASLAGDFYESFEVNSRNFMEHEIIRSAFVFSDNESGRVTTILGYQTRQIIQRIAEVFGC
jgi:hypothetical protein